MQHLDEGTVHAWLDGELSETESAAAAQHVAECTQCAELVAEARGLIAGASRVVSALDAGPAGVIPRAQPANGAGFWRRLTRSPSRMAMAATILVAVGVTLTVRRAPHESTSARPAIVESPAVVSAPASSPATAVGAPASPGQSSSVAAELKDRATRTPSNKPASAAAPASSVGDQAAFVGAARRQSATIGGSADNALADKKKDADVRRDHPVPGAQSDLERGKAAPVAKTLAEVRPQIQAAPAASVSQTREAGAQPQNSRTAAFDAINEVSLQGCYRLSVDTSAWQGVLPASFMLVGSPSRVQGAVGGQAGTPQAAPASSNAVQRFAQKAELAGFGVHAIGTNGQADSTPIGDWTTVSPAMARVRFLNASQPRLVTVFISAGSPIARVAAGDRTDSLRVARIVCPR